MTDESTPTESPTQRALRMKKAALEAKPKAPGNATPGRRQAASMTAGASKPWLKK